MTESAAPTPKYPVFTVGHSNRTWSEFLLVLRSASINSIFDVRRYPVSRRYPQYSREEMERALAEASIKYRHFPELGGFRTDAAGTATSSNDGWPAGFFRSYADYAQSPNFHRSLREMCRVVTPRTALMCAEKDWRTCHRQIITDYMLTAGYKVIHLIDDVRSEEARITPFASVGGAYDITYKAARQQIPFDF